LENYKINDEIKSNRKKTKGRTKNYRKMKNVKSVSIVSKTNADKIQNNKNY